MFNIQSLVETYGYKATTKFDGLIGRKGRQDVTVVAACLVPADWNGDKKIVAKAIVHGKRGAEYSAYIYSDNAVSVL